MGLGRHRAARHGATPASGARRRKPVAVPASSGSGTDVAVALKAMLRIAAAMDAIIQTQQDTIERLRDDVASHERNIAELLKRIEMAEPKSASPAPATLDAVLDEDDRALLERLLREVPARTRTELPNA